MLSYYKQNTRLKQKSPYMIFLVVTLTMNPQTIFLKTCSTIMDVRFASNQDKVRWSKRIYRKCGQIAHYIYISHSYQQFVPILWRTIAYKNRKMRLLLFFFFNIDGIIYVAMPYLTGVTFRNGFSDLLAHFVLIVNHFIFLYQHNIHIKLDAIVGNNL